MKTIKPQKGDTPEDAYRRFLKGGFGDPKTKLAGERYDIYTEALAKELAKKEQL